MLLIEIREQPAQRAGDPKFYRTLQASSGKSNIDRADDAAADAA